MPTAASTLAQRVRRRVRDFPDLDATSASLASTGSTVSVPTGTGVYFPNERIEIDGEAMLVLTVAATTLGVRRATWGSTAATHTSGATILRDPAFFTVDILDGLNAGLDNLWPLFYRDVMDDTTVVPNGVATEFAIPTSADLDDQPFRRIYMVEARDVGDTAWHESRWWRIQRSASPKLKFGVAPITGSSIRVRGYTPFPHLTASGSLDAQFPYHAEDLLVQWAANQLTASGEAARVRYDRGPVDQREQATRTGSSMAVSRDFRQSFFVLRSELAMPPMHPSTVSVLAGV